MKGMEGANKNTREVLDFESGEDGVWRMKEAEASLKAEDLINGIDEFEAMEPPEQVEALVSLMTDLAVDNDNRFIVEVLAKKAKAIEATEVYRKTMEGLRIEAGSIINETI